MSYILFTAVALFFLNLYASSTLRSITFQSKRDYLSDKAQTVSAALLPLDELSASKTEQAVSALKNLHATRIVVTDAGGTALYDSLTTGNAAGKLLLFPEIATALEGKDVFYSTYADAAVESRCARCLMRGGQVVGAVYLMDYDTDQGAFISALQTNVLHISLAIELGIVLMAFVFSAAFSRRLRRILFSVHKMRDGDYSAKIELHGHDELNQLGREFNELADRLTESEARRRQFVSDASHELKTPLASIKLLADSVLQNSMDPETEHEFIGDIAREADRLGRLSQKLLMLTKLDSQPVEEREILDAAPVAEKVLRMLRPLAALRAITVEQTITPGCTLMTVEDDLYQIVFNLVENAIKYNRDGGSVLLTLGREGEDVVLTVADRGVGIPADSMAHIFERFYRVDKARSRAAGGAGLGLSIVHDMVERNFGTITAAAREGGGTVFTVRFPLFETEEEVEE